MRRLSACLMIAALCAALVPSATLAVKPPPPGIESLVVEAVGDTPNSGLLCRVKLTATFHGRASEVKFMDTYNTPWYEPIPKKATSVESWKDLPYATLANTDAFWQAALVNKKQVEIPSTLVTTGTDIWGSGPGYCPGGITLASWTASS